MTEAFSTREIAIGAWILVGLGFALSVRGVRESLLGLLKAFFADKIMAFTGVMVLYSAGIVGVLAALGFWGFALLKDTIFWFIFSGFALAFRVATATDGELALRKVLKDTVRVVIVLEFLTNAYTLSLMGELLLVPGLVFLGLLDAVARTDKKHASVAHLTGTLLAAAGFAVVGFAVSSVLSDGGQLWTITSLKLLLIAPVLSICFVPFLYLVALFMAYDRLYGFLLPALDRRGVVARHARRHLRAFCGLSLRRARALLQERRQELMLIRSEEDVDRLFEQIGGR